MRKNISWLILVLLITVSCKTKQESELNYMQNIEEVAIENVANVSGTKLQIGDQLMILVSGRDTAILNPFNQNYSSSDPIRNGTLGNVPVQNPRITGPTYFVGSQGEIDFPILGKLQAEGKTIDELRDDIKERLRRYVKTPTSVNIRLTNFEISVFGEVNRPNKYRVEGVKKPTVLDALALAGDLTMYGKRDNVLVIRNENGNVVKGRLNLKDANFINSPYYYLKQGDAVVVYANENKHIKARTNPNTGIYISIVSVSLTAISLAFALLRK